jgi:DNA-binding MarR family transcriptional regulator
MCAGTTQTTISEIGRQLGITRQGAGKVVTKLRDRRYVTVTASSTSGREKIVKPTARALDYLAAQRKATRKIERRLRTELGEDVFAGLYRLVEKLAGDDDLRLSDYLRKMSHF